MLSIDETIVYARLKAKEIRENIIDGDNLEPYESYYNAMVAKSAEEHEQFAEWLEELKKRRSEDYGYLADIHQSIGYRKAVDDFVKKINESNQGHWRPTRYEHGEVVSETMSYDIGTIRLIAEQLKAGDNNGT